MSNDATTSEPKRSSGRLPEGYNDSGRQELVAWPEVRQRLEQAKHFWFSTADADGARMPARSGDLGSTTRSTPTVVSR